MLARVEPGMEAEMEFRCQLGWELRDETWDGSWYESCVMRQEIINLTRGKTRTDPQLSFPETTNEFLLATIST